MTIDNTTTDQKTAKPLDHLQDAKRGLEESVNTSRKREEAADLDTEPTKVGEGLGGRGIEHGNPSLVNQLSTVDLKEKARLLGIDGRDQMSRAQLMDAVMSAMNPS